MKRTSRLWAAFLSLALLSGGPGTSAPGQIAGEQSGDVESFNRYSFYSGGLRLTGFSP